MGHRLNGWNFVTAGTARDANSVEEIMIELNRVGYDGAVNPTKYLDAWKRLEDVRILPAVPFSTPGGAEASRAPPPGAILLQSTDISTASGLKFGDEVIAVDGLPTQVVLVERGRAREVGGRRRRVQREAGWKTARRD